MSLEQASVFLSGGILITLGFVSIISGIILINRLIFKFWKPVTIFTKESFTLFGSRIDEDPLNILTQEEYNKLIAHLEKIRKEKIGNDDEIDKKLN